MRNPVAKYSRQQNRGVIHKDRKKSYIPPILDEDLRKQSDIEYDDWVELVVIPDQIDDEEEEWLERAYNDLRDGHFLG